MQIYKMTFANKTAKDMAFDNETEMWKWIEQYEEDGKKRVATVTDQNGLEILS